jgi:hypothetical protein
MAPYNMATTIFGGPTSLISGNSYLTSGGLKALEEYLDTTSTTHWGSASARPYVETHRHMAAPEQAQESHTTFTTCNEEPAPDQDIRDQPYPWAKDTEEYHDCKYHLRPTTIGAQIHFPNSWIDEDNSGSYDPTGKLTRLTPPVPPPPPKRKRQGQDGEDIDAPKRTKLTTWLGGRQRGDKLIVVLKLNSIAGREALKKNPASDLSVEEISDSDNWNDERLGTCAESGDSLQSSVSSLPSYSLRSQRATLPNGSVLRRGACFPGNKSANRGITLGNPLARGCKGCLEIGHPCSLLGCNTKWPCSLCLEDKIDCELIIPATLKRQCGGCKRGNLTCSYSESEENHDMPCKECQESNTYCIAGPQTTRVRLPPVQNLTGFKESLGKVSLDPKRRYKACTPCRRTRVKCSIRNYQAKGPCGLCRRLGRECTFEDWEHPSRVNYSRKDLNGSGSGEQGEASTSWPPQTSKLDLVSRPAIRTEESMMSSLHRDTIDLTVPKSKVSWPTRKSKSPAEVKIIKTCFAHPMTFNNLPNDGPPPCHFCEDITFGINGYGERSVEVIDYKDGNGYTEVRGGHTARNKEPTRMCMLCSLRRIHIVNCHSHEISELDDLNTEDSADDLAWEILEQGCRPEDCPVPWCSLCPAPASFGCCKRQTHDMFEERITKDNADEAYGCGLLLCESCGHTVREYDGKLHGAVKDLKKRFDSWGGKLRADVQFLLSGDDTRQWHG